MSCTQGPHVAYTGAFAGGRLCPVIVTGEKLTPTRKWTCHAPLVLPAGPERVMSTRELFGARSPLGGNVVLRSAACAPISS